MKKRRIYLIFIFVTISFIAVAQANLAIINDSDGYTNIRRLPDSRSEIIDKAYDDEIFHYWADQNSNWWKVSIKTNQFGYMHKSRIQPVKELSEGELESLLQLIYSRYLMTLKKEMKDGQVAYDYSNLSIYYGRDLICKTKNQGLLNLLIQILENEPKPAYAVDDVTGITIAEIYNCQPQWTLASFEKLDSLEEIRRISEGYEESNYDADRYDETQRLFAKLKADLLKR